MTLYTWQIFRPQPPTCGSLRGPHRWKSFAPTYIKAFAGQGVLLSNQRPFIPVANAGANRPQVAYYMEAAMAKIQGDPIFTIKLAKGLADRQRLPLAHVLSILDEVRQLITDVGRDIQAQKGVEGYSGDFGLELIAGESGMAFLPGSVQAQIAITQNVQTGILAAKQVVRTVEHLEAEDLPGIGPDQTIDPKIVLRLNRIARIQRRDKTELHLAISPGGKAAPLEAKFGDAGMAAARALQAPTFQMEDLTIYGKLYELADHDPTGEDEDKGFWGELKRDNGEVWRVQFKAADQDKVTPLFRKQVAVSGTAVYYRVTTPKMVASRIEADKDRDYEAAFDELFGCDKQLYKTDFDTLLRQMRGE